VNVRLLYRKTLQQIRQEGLRGVFYAASKYLHRSAADDFDLRYGTDTSGLEPLWKLKVTSRNAVFGHSYDPTTEEELASAIRFLGEDPRAFTFVDLGCGKGRTLLVASKLGFKHVIGVEFARELVEIARTNLAKMGISNASVIHADATEFSFPEGELVIYLFNPFTEEVMRKVVANLRNSPAKKLYVIYTNPVCAAVFDSSGFLSRFGCPPARRYPQIIWVATN
jgi:SAM-dependent methyltransferase